MTASAFVDTNILVYAHDSGNGHKHEVAKDLVEGLWATRSGVISTQVLQEFYVNVRRKSTQPMSIGAARSLVEDYTSWRVVVNDSASILDALHLEERYQVSFWDALILQAASTAGVDVLYSEDLSHDQEYAGVRLVDPFRSG